MRPLTRVQVNAKGKDALPFESRCFSLVTKDRTVDLAVSTLPSR
jgi:hypothetical protein